MWIESLGSAHDSVADATAVFDKRPGSTIQGRPVTGNRKRDVIGILVWFLSTTALLLGCGGSNGSPLGQVVVDWAISTSCSVSGVVEIEARLVVIDGIQIGQIYDADRRACNSVDPVVFESVEPGTYRVEVEGFDTGMKGTYFGAIDAVHLGKGRILETPVVKLTQKKTAIDVQWVFANGKLCSHNGVTEVQLAIFDADTSVQYFEVELASPFACDPFSMPVALRTIGEIPATGYIPGGVLVGGLTPSHYLIYAFGVDMNGDKVMKGMASMKTELGQVAVATIALVPCQSGDYPTITCD